MADAAEETAPSSSGGGGDGDAAGTSDPPSPASTGAHPVAREVGCVGASLRMPDMGSSRSTSGARVAAKKRQRRAALAASADLFLLFFARALTSQPHAFFYRA